MQIKRGWDGGVYAVFQDEDHAAEWRWLFGKILRRSWVSFGEPFNAWQLF